MDRYDEGAHPRRAAATPDDPLPPADGTGASGAPDAPHGPEAPSADAPDAPDVHGASDALDGPAPSADASDASDAPVGRAAPAGIAALSLRYQIAAALALAVVAVGALVHLGMVFLHVAPSNTLTKQHGRAVDDWIYPEFEQNWKLFAPNPLQQNIDVQVRVDLRTDEGGARTTGWYDLSALDGADIRHNPLPSHTQQNELRRAWDFYASSHDNANRPSGLRGELSETYLRRIVARRVDRLSAEVREGTVERVQLRSSTTNVQPPPWSAEKVSDQPVYRVLPWWTLSRSDTGTGADA
jgi:hypothetical protein